jgi:hypothetical protein
MYEYRLQTHYGNAPPSTLIAPPDFRLRDIRFVEQSRGIYNEPMHLTGDVTYIKTSNESVNGVWLMVWERYVPENEGTK